MWDDAQEFLNTRKWKEWPNLWPFLNIDVIQSLKQIQNVPKAAAEETNWQNIPKQRLHNLLIGNGYLNLSLIWKLSVRLTYFKGIVVFVEPKFF